MTAGLERSAAVKEVGDMVISALKEKEMERDGLREQYATLEGINKVQRAEKVALDFPPCPMCGAVNSK